MAEDAVIQKFVRRIWLVVMLAVLLAVGGIILGAYFHRIPVDLPPATPSASTIGFPLIPFATTVTDNDSAFNAPAVPAPKDPPPNVIKVGPFLYTIVYRADRDMPDLYGQTSPRRKQIAINVDQTHADLKDTVLHELIHCAADVGNKQQDDGGETPEIKAVTPTLIQVLHDNPELVEWLRK